jgi:hypothetical protein
MYMARGVCARKLAVARNFEIKTKTRAVTERTRKAVRRVIMISALFYEVTYQDT